MKYNNFKVNYLENNIDKWRFFNKNKGFCEVCGEPLGEIISNKGILFCYKCAGYKKLDIEFCINQCDQELKKLRKLFHEGIINGDVDRYFRNYLTSGEALYNSEEKKDYAYISHPIKKAVSLNFINFVISNVAIKWILEDLNFKTQQSDEYSNDTFTIPLRWLQFFKRMIYMRNNLGFFIEDKLGPRQFYYFQILDFYNDSLNQFGLIEPNRIDPVKFNSILEDLLAKESDPNYVKEFINFDLPLIFVCMSYLQYPNMEDRIFTFQDIIYDIKIIQYIADIYSYYNDKRASSPEECNSGGTYYIIKSFKELKKDFPQIIWDDLLYYHIISSQSNPMSFPLLIEYKGTIAITPTRLKIAYELMFEAFVHNAISNRLSKAYENTFQEKVLEILRKNNFLVIDPINAEKWTNIIDKKKNTFEFDILGIYQDYIFIVECKSFHPSAFYRLSEARLRRKCQLDHFKTQFNNKIKPWLISKLKTKPKNEYIAIKSRKWYQTDNKYKPYIIKIPKEFYNIGEKKLIGLYITQLNECFKDNSEIIQIYCEEIEEFINSIK